MKTFLMLASIVLSCTASAQSFFKPVPKVNARTNFAFRAITVTKDSTMNAWRPLVNIAAYAEPGNILMAGAGLSYQHLKWDITNQRWNCEWSVAAMGWAGGSVAPKTPADIMSYGIMFGVLNNTVMAGPAINSGKLIAVISIGINLNN